MTLIAISPLHPVSSGGLRLGEACALVGGKVDPVLANECVWTKNVTDVSKLKGQLAFLVKGRWTLENGNLWLRPNRDARAAWDRVQEDREDALFVKSVSQLRPPSARELEQAAMYVESLPDDAPVVARMRKTQRLVTLRAQNPEIAQALVGSHLGRLREGETRFYGNGGEPVPPRLADALRIVQKRLSLVGAGGVDPVAKGFGESVAVTREGGGFTFEARLADGTRAFDTISLAASGATPGSIRIVPGAASDLFLRSLSGQILTEGERRVLQTALSEEPLRLLACEELDAEFGDERRSVLVLLADDRLSQVAATGGVVVPKLGDDYRRETVDGSVMIAPTRLAETTRSRTDRDGLRALLRRRNEGASFALRDACVASVPLGTDFRDSVASPSLRALWPEIYRFYSENPWPWVRTLGTLSDRTFAEASSTAFPLDRLSGHEEARFRVQFGTDLTSGTLSIQRQTKDVFRLDAVAAVRSSGVGFAASDLSPEAFGGYLAKPPNSALAGLPADLYRAESATIRIDAPQGTAFGTVTLRLRLGTVQNGDLSQIPEEIRVRVRQSQEDGQRPDSDGNGSEPR